MLFRPCNIFCTFTSHTSHSLYAVPYMAVLCSSLISCFPVTLLGYCLNNCETVPVALLLPVSLLLSHSTCAEFLLWDLYILKSSRFFVDHISVSRNCNIFWHARSLFIVTDYDVRFIVSNSSVGSHWWFHNVVTLPSWLVSTDFGTWSYRCLLSNFTHIPSSSSSSSPSSSSSSSSSSSYYYYYCHQYY